MLKIIFSTCELYLETLAKRRAHEQEKSKNLFQKLADERLPHSMGQYGRNGMRSYSDGFHPPWLVHFIAEIATGFENIKIFQERCVRSKRNLNSKIKVQVGGNYYDVKKLSTY